MSAVQMRAARRRDLAHLPRRTLLLLGATIVLLIVGLLGMHALSGGSSHAAGVEHGGALASVAAHAHAAGSAGAAEQCGDGCAVPAPGHAPDAPGHVGIAACVLALLAALILLVPPVAAARAGTLTIVRRPVLVASAARPFLPPPSLTVLSISRT